MDNKNMDIKLTLGSLFSGSGGFELGGILAGIRPVWASVIELFPIRVTMKWLPSVKHLGNINSIQDVEQWDRAPERIFRAFRHCVLRTVPGLFIVTFSAT